MPSRDDVDARILNLLGNNSVFWTEEERRSAFNEGLAVWDVMTSEWTGKASIVPTGLPILDIPRQIISAQRVSYIGPASGVGADLQNGLISSYRLEEVAGTRLDSVGSNHLSSINGVTRAAGKVGFGANFTASSTQSLDIISCPSLHHGDFSWTWTGWFRFTSTVDSRGIIFMGDFTSGLGIVVRLQPSWSIQFLVYNGTTSPFCQVNFSRIGKDDTTAIYNPVNEWHFFRVWFDSIANTINLSVDENFVDSESFTGVPNDLDGGFRLGSQQTGTRLMQGQIDAVHRWNRLLTEEEAAYVYNQGLGREITLEQGVTRVPLDLTSVEALDMGTPGWENRTNLVVNGSFEDWTAGVPDGWDTVLYGGEFAQETDPRNVMFGGSSIRVGPTAVSHAYQLIPANAGQPHYVEFWAKRDPNFPAIPYVEVNDALGITNIRYNITNTEFQRFSTYFVPNRNNQIEVTFVSNGGQAGVLFVDGVRVYAAQTPTSWAPVGFNKIALYPVPVGGTIEIEGLVDPPYFQGSGFEMSDDKLDVLTSYAHHILTFKEGTSEFKATEGNMAKMVREAGERNREFRATAMYREFMGEIRDDSDRPRATGMPSIGGRA